MLSWDRSHQYVLYRYWNDRTRLTIRFQAATPSLQELVALRRCLPQFRDVPPAAMRSQIGDSQELSLGDMPSRDARKLIETIEGLAPEGEFHPVQQAFWEKHGLQCGFCTPGMLMTAHALLTQEPNADENRIREAISGNLCRCTGYVPIVEAIAAARPHYAGDT